MTIEEAKRRAELYSALAERKTIQVQNSYTDEWRDLDINKIYGFINGFNYRIKPEPKYRPFRTQEECWEEMHNHPDFGWVIELNTQEYLHIGRLGENEINKRFCITFSCDEGHNTPFDKMISDYTFTDGTPFGVKEE